MPFAVRWMAALVEMATAYVIIADDDSDTAKFKSSIKEPFWKSARSTMRNLFIQHCASAGEAIEAFA